MKFILWISIISMVFSLINAFELNNDFREPKNILFGNVGGGTSHINWVLSILEELANRGHNITFVTHDEKKHPRFHTISLGPNDVDLSIVGNKLRYIDNAAFFKEMYNTIHNSYDDKMKQYKNIYDATNIDVALCDHFAVPCIDITKNVNVPLIITTALALSKDASAPYINNLLESNDTTTADMNFMTRMMSKIIRPLSIVMDIQTSVKQMKQKKAELGWLPLEGMPAFEDDWKDSLKLVNNLFGFEPARPLGPLVELIGPIMNTKYPDLTLEIETFLNNHKKIAYIAFGQSVKIQKNDITLILTALIDSIERNALDGFIWATRDLIHQFPLKIVSSSGNIYSVSDMLQKKYDHALFLNWAPQMAILSHPVTQLFVSHGGLGSLHEAMYAGVRTALYPFYGDQPSNSYMMRVQELGVQLSYDMKQSDASDLIESIANDANGEYQNNVNRFKAMVQIHSKHGVLRGADLVEEVIFANVNGLLPHRYEVSQKMSFIKTHNLDLFVSLLVVVFIFVAATLFFIYYLIQLAASTSIKPKNKDI